MGNLTHQASPDTGTTTNTYDPAGNLLTQTDAKGQTTTYAYDALNRVTLITFHDGSKQTYAYDAGTNGIGRLAVHHRARSRATSQTSLTRVCLRPAGRVTSETRTIRRRRYTTGYRYDSYGPLSDRITYPSGRTRRLQLRWLGPRERGINTTPSAASARAARTASPTTPSAE